MGKRRTKDSRAASSLRPLQSLASAFGTRSQVRKEKPSGKCRGKKEFGWEFYIPAAKVSLALGKASSKFVIGAAWERTLKDGIGKCSVRSGEYHGNRLRVAIQWKFAAACTSPGKTTQFHRQQGEKTPLLLRSGQRRSRKMGLARHGPTQHCRGCDVLMNNRKKPGGKDDCRPHTPACRGKIC